MLLPFCGFSPRTVTFLVTEPVTDPVVEVVGLAATIALVRTTMTITPEDCRIDADELDPTAPGYGAHLPFHAILQRCGIAWRAHLGSLGQGEGAAALDTGVIVPNVDADFRAEVHVGRLDIDVVLVAIGTTSFTLRCDVHQDDVVAARVTVVLVSFDYERRAPVPLTAEQRAVLEPGRVSG